MEGKEKYLRRDDLNLIYLFFLYLVYITTVSANTTTIGDQWIDTVQNGIHTTKIGVDTYHNGINWVEGKRPATIKNNIIHDTNNLSWESQSDGLYKLSYEDKINYFGFGISGIYNSAPFLKLSTDFGWNTDIINTSNGYNVSSRTITPAAFANGWFTNISFGNTTKIENRITNTLPLPITNGKFWYFFTVNNGDSIVYNSTTYNITSSTNISKSGNLNNIQSFLIGNKLVFNFVDIVENGFNITDFYIINASNLGFNSSHKIAAIGFTKGSGTLASGATIIIDPTVSSFNSDADTYVDSINPTTNFGSSTVMKIGSAVSGTQRVLIKFNLSSFNSTDNIMSATLSLYETVAATCCVDDGHIRRADTSWDETTGWNIKPVMNTSQISTISLFNTNAWVSSDVTNGVRDFVNNGTPNYGWYIESDGTPAGSYGEYRTKEHANRPFLNITYGNVAPTIPTNYTNFTSKTNLTPTITWTKGTDANNDTITTYIYFGLNETNLTLEGIYNGTSDTLGTNLTLIENTNYTYRMRSYDDYAFSDNTSLSNFTTGRKTPVFSNATIPASGTVSVSLNIDIDVVSEISNISTVNLTIRDPNAIETTYPMSISTGNTYRKSYTSAIAGTYTVLYFNATEETGLFNSTVTNSPISISLSGEGGTGGGGGGGDGSAPTPALQKNNTPVRASPTTQINLPNLTQDPIGMLILEVFLIIGAVMIVLFFFKNDVKIGTPITGLLLVIISSWVMGWWT